MFRKIKVLVSLIAICAATTNCSTRIKELNASSSRTRGLLGDSLKAVLSSAAKGLLPSYDPSGKIIPGAGPSSAGFQKPCAGRMGSAHPDQGSGNCTGNLFTEIGIPTSGLTLSHNSLGEAIQYGFGKGFSLSADLRFVLLQGSQAVWLMGDGTTYNFHLSSGKYVSDDLRRSTSSFTATSPTLMTQTDFDGSEMVYSAVAGDTTQFVLTSIKDRNGNTTKITRDADGQITQIADPFKKTVKISYSAKVGSALKLASTITDVAGQDYTLSYDSSNAANARLTAFTQPDSHAWKFSYDGASGRLSSSTSAEGKSLTYTYYISGDLESIKNALGYLTVVYYTSKGTSVATSFETLREFFNSDGAMTASLNNGASTDITRDSKTNRVTSVKDPLGNVTSYTYDQADALVSTATYPKVAGSAVVTYKRNSERRLTSITTAMPATTILGKTQAVVTVETYDLTKFGLLSSINQNSGADITNYSYDSKGNLQAVIKKGVKQDVMLEQYTYTLAGDFNPAQGQIKSRTDVSGLTTFFKYDSKGYLASVTDPLGRVVSYTNDSLGNVITKTTPTLVTTTSFNKMGVQEGISKITSKSGSGGTTSIGISRSYFGDGSPYKISSSVTNSGGWSTSRDTVYDGYYPGNISKDTVSNSQGGTYVLGN